MACVINNSQNHFIVVFINPRFYNSMNAVSFLRTMVSRALDCRFDVNIKGSRITRCLCDWWCCLVYVEHSSGELLWRKHWAISCQDWVSQWVSSLASLMVIHGTYLAEGLLFEEKKSPFHIGIWFGNSSSVLHCIYTESGCGNGIDPFGENYCCHD